MSYMTIWFNNSGYSKIKWNPLNFNLALFIMIFKLFSLWYLVYEPS